MRKTRHNWSKIADLLENWLLDLQSKLGCLLKQLKMPQNCSICIHYKTSVIYKLCDTDHKGRLHLVNLYFHWVHDRPHTHCVAMKPGSTHWVQILRVTGFPPETMHCHMMVCRVLWKQLEVSGSLPCLYWLRQYTHTSVTCILMAFLTLVHIFWAKHCNRSHHKHSSNARIIRRKFWPPCLLHLSPCDFDLWGMLMDKR